MNGYIIYGRLKSKRLPKKGLLKIDNKSLIRIFIERISMSSKIDKIVFATSDLKDDQPLKELVVDEGLEVFCGHPDDVLLRLYETAKRFDFDIFLTTMIDGPFQFQEVIDATIDKLVSEKYDMLYSFPGQPNGTECYGLRTESVKKIADIKGTKNTECWGKYFTDTGMFKWGEINLFEKHPHLKDFRLTIDYPEDYEFCKKLYNDLLVKYGVNFNLDNLLQILDSPEYKKKLENMVELEKKWEKHFVKGVSDVDKDIKRIKKQFC